MTVIYVPRSFLRWTAVFQKSKDSVCACEAVEPAERYSGCACWKMSVHTQQMCKAATTQRAWMFTAFLLRQRNIATSDAYLKTPKMSDLSSENKIVLFS